MPRVRIHSVLRALMPGFPVPSLLAASLLILLLITGFPARSQTTPAPSQTTNERLILKDGTYQVVSQYQVVGDRVRYLSAERGQWEELPSDLVDWAATEKWAKEHALGTHAPSPPGASAGDAAAAAIDKEEQQERAEQMARTPEVMPGLLLPDQQGVWVLDTYQSHPELVQLQQESGDLNRQTGHNVLRGLLNPSGHTKQAIEMEGAVSKKQLHVDDPVLYVSLSTKDEAAPDAESTALTVNTHGASDAPDQNSFSSPASQYAIVPVENNYKRNYRVVRAVNFGSGASPGGDAIPTKAEILPGKHWMKLTALQPLSIGDYALVEILSPHEVNLSVWGFRVDPQGPDNQNAILPLDRK